MQGKATSDTPLRVIAFRYAATHSMQSAPVPNRVAVPDWQMTSDRNPRRAVKVANPVTDNASARQHPSPTEVVYCVASMCVCWHVAASIL